MTSKVMNKSNNNKIKRNYKFNRSLFKQSMIKRRKMLTRVNLAKLINKRMSIKLQAKLIKKYKQNKMKIKKFYKRKMMIKNH